jgi:dihydroflavonol-4-reductase
MKTVLVTGATGFLGKHLIEQLRRAEGAIRLRILCRGASPWDEDYRSVVQVDERRRQPGGAATGNGIEVIHGDVTSRDDVFRAAEGASEIYHLAGVVSRDPQAGPLLYRTHIEGTRNVCEAARRRAAQRVIVVSSSGTVAVGREPFLHNEKSGYKHEIVGEWPYYLSKIFTEKLAFTYFERSKLPVMVANPSLLLGPGDDRQSSTRDIALFLNGQILAVPLGGLNFVDARDAADGLIRIMRSGRPGERYLLGGTNWSFRGLIEKVSKISGVRAPKFQPSLQFSLLSAPLLRRLLPLLGKRFELDDASIKMSSLFWYCDSTKARSELGFETRDPMETLRDTIDDLRRKT